MKTIRVLILVTILPVFYLGNLLVNDVDQIKESDNIALSSQPVTNNSKKKQALDDKISIQKQDIQVKMVEPDNKKLLSDQDKSSQTVEQEVKVEIKKEKPAFSQNLESVKTEKVAYKEIVNQQDIECTRKYINDSSVIKGTSFVQTAGQDGIREIVSKIKYVNDQEVSREIISDKIIKDPVDEVVIVGSKVEYLDSSGQTGLMIEEINQSRNEKGLQSLNRSLRLDEAASIRVREIVNTFSHTRPDGRPFYSVDPDFVAGENIAYSACDVCVLHERFLNSPSHRDNILRPEFKSVGVASFKEATGPTYWVILFSRY